MTYHEFVRLAPETQSYSVSQLKLGQDASPISATSLWLQRAEPARRADCARAGSPCLRARGPSHGHQQEQALRALAGGTLQALVLERMQQDEQNDSLEDLVRRAALFCTRLAAVSQSTIICGAWRGGEPLRRVRLRRNGLEGPRCSGSWMYVNATARVSTMASMARMGFDLLRLAAPRWSIVHSKSRLERSKS
ncbi:unnamed protein product [Prorocentrum cordatum]|uniref:Uncharacterized protein n=1 Tax=Prorocentrum cordatum TaxID=2364126 RepID=A0ABN9PYN7_9DINO|nr:unnamed protein product [Polarella glacialis]